MKSDGAPVDWIETFDPIVVTISGLGLSAKASNPNSAKLLIDFATSKRGQQMVRGMRRIPARTRHRTAGAEDGSEQTETKSRAQRSLSPPRRLRPRVPQDFWNVKSVIQGENNETKLFSTSRFDRGIFSLCRTRLTRMDGGKTSVLSRQDDQYHHQLRRRRPHRHRVTEFSPSICPGIFPASRRLRCRRWAEAAGS